ncbi:MAG: DUF3367 domain-containing protein [Actinobacteria bacterium]|nr:DUF3367 domain-containing protein [Actinomycetota bacterium]
MTAAPARLRAWAPTAALAAVTYVPLLLTHRGMVGADTKSYLYLDPDRLLGRAAAMWDPNIGLGTVTHQNIGYLWPMGPYYWAFQHLGVPDWIAQRLWLGSIIFLAGLGVRYLMRTLGQQGPQVVASMFLYAFTPYVLTLAARLSVILLPFAGLPWLIALTIRAARERSWVHPAAFALIITTIGSSNATALILAGFGPVLWLPFAVRVQREISLRDALATVVRIGVLTTAASLWWISGLWAQGKFGIDILKYTETARTVADSSTPPEVLRGLGYWFFYGGDKLGPWIEPSREYTQNPPLILLTYLIPSLALLGAGLLRWRYRAYFVVLAVVGLVAAVGAHPWGSSPPWGRAVAAFLQTRAGFAMRSLPRAVPLVALAFAVLAGAGLAALGAWARRTLLPAAGATAAIAVLALPPLWTGNMVAQNLQRPEKVPAYWVQAAAWLQARDRGAGGWRTRVLEVPGSDFASYRWGSTVDPITPGLMDRPYVARELIPYGSPPSADLLNAFDRQMQESVLDPRAIAPVARLMGVGDIVQRADLAYERYNLARPRQVYQVLRAAPGLGRPRGFGPAGPNIPDPLLPLQDEVELASPPTLPDPRPVTVFPVKGAPSIVRAASADTPVVLAGDGEGVVDLAGAGLLRGDEVILSSAWFAAAPDALARELRRPGAVLVVTDTNRRAARRWGTVRETNGATERAGQRPLVPDPSDNRLDVFPAAGDDSRTVVEQRGGVRADATSYGNPVSYTPESRPANAVDGDPSTAWSTAAFASAIGERLLLTYQRPRTTDRITLQQFDSGVQNRWITKVRLRFDDGKPVDVALGDASRRAPGATLRFPSRTFRKLSIEIRATDPGRMDSYQTASGVGFADVRLGSGDRRLDEVVRLPRDLLDTAGTASASRALAIVLTRQRTTATSGLRSDEELRIARSFTLPTTRSFGISATVRLDPRAPEGVIDRLLGIPPAARGGVDGSSSRRQPGDPLARATSAIDGDPATHWSPGFLGQAGEWVAYESAKPIAFDRMDLRVVADGRHSVPTRVRVEADGRPVATLTLPAVTDQARKDATTLVPLRLPRTVRAGSIKVVVEATRPVQTRDWISGATVEMPVGLAELGIPGLQVTQPQGRFDDRCRALVSADRNRVGLRVGGTIADALAGRALPARPCDVAGGLRLGEGLSLGAGAHVLRTSEGKVGGLDVDQLVLRSTARGAADPGAGALVPERARPEVRVVGGGRTRMRVVVGARAGATWLVLGQSQNAGWRATAGGRDLGPSTLVDGYANGWLLPAGTGPVTVDLRWTPQRVVWGAIAVSVLAVAACLVLLALGWWKRRGRVLVPPLGDQPLPLDLRRAWRSSGAPPSWRATLLAAILTGAGAALVIGAAAGLVAALAALAVCRLRRARAVTALLPAGLLMLAGLYTVARQVRHRLPPGFDWTTYFTLVEPVAYMVAPLLLLELVVERLWSGRLWSGRRAAAGGAGTAPEGVQAPAASLTRPSASRRSVPPRAET